MRFWITIFLIMVFIVSKAQTVNENSVSMKDYVDIQATLNRRIAEVQFQNILDNVNKANTATEKRFDGVNEFRLQLKDQAGTFITRQELFAWIIAIIGVFFGYSNWKRGQKESTEGKNIVSGDRVEVKK